MTGQFDHFIITLWNITFQSILTSNVDDKGQTWGAFFDEIASQKRLSEEWLNYRADLFKRFTLPTVAAQSCKSFKWLILFDENTPSAYIESLGGQFHSLLVSHDNIIDKLINKIKQMSKTNWVLTTNLDSDDGLSVNFIEELQRQIILESQMIIAADGIKVKPPENIALGFKSKKSPFYSILSPKEMSKTVLSDSHGGFSDMKQTYIKNVAWLQVCHGDNLSNRMKPKSSDQYQPFYLYCKQFGLKEKDFPCAYKINGKENISIEKGPKSIL